MSTTIQGILYTRIGTTSTACVGTEDGSKNAVSKSYIGKALLLSHVTIGSIYCIVTMIGKWAFYECKGLTNLLIPSTITILKRSCFYSLSLTSPLVIPASVKSVESFFIEDCSPIIIFCGTEEPQTINVGWSDWISNQFTGKVSVPNEYKSDKFLKKNIEKRELTECAASIYASVRIKRRQKWLILVFFIHILLLS